MKVPMKTEVFKKLNHHLSTLDNPSGKKYKINNSNTGRYLGMLIATSGGEFENLQWGFYLGCLQLPIKFH